MSAIRSVYNNNRRQKVLSTTPSSSYKGSSLSKIRKPNTFNSNKAQLKQFLLQAQVYIYFNKDQFEDNQQKVI